MIRILALAAALALAGCQTTQEVGTQVRKTWAGVPADSFFVRYGPPQSEYRLEGGDTIYIWSSGLDTEVHHTTRTISTVLPNGKSMVTTVPGPDRVIPTECAFKIIASRDGRITDIAIHKDRSGAWEFSHCARYLQ